MRGLDSLVHALKKRIRLEWLGAFKLELFMGYSALHLSGLDRLELAGGVARLNLHISSDLR